MTTITKTARHALPRTSGQRSSVAAGIAMSVAGAIAVAPAVPGIQAELHAQVVKVEHAAVDLAAASYPLQNFLNLLNGWAYIAQSSAGVAALTAGNNINAFLGALGTSAQNSIYFTENTVQQYVQYLNTYLATIDAPLLRTLVATYQANSRGRLEGLNRLLNGQPFGLIPGAETTVTALSSALFQALYNSASFDASARAGIINDPLNPASYLNAFLYTTDGNQQAANALLTGANTALDTVTDTGAASLTTVVKTVLAAELTRAFAWNATVTTWYNQIPAGPLRDLAELVVIGANRHISGVISLQAELPRLISTSANGATTRLDTTFAALHDINNTLTGAYQGAVSTIWAAPTDPASYASALAQVYDGNSYSLNDILGAVDANANNAVDTLGTNVQTVANFRAASILTDTITAVAYLTSIGAPSALISAVNDFGTQHYQFVQTLGTNVAAGLGQLGTAVTTLTTAATNLNDAIRAAVDNALGSSTSALAPTSASLLASPHSRSVSTPTTATRATIATGGNNTIRAAIDNTLGTATSAPASVSALAARFTPKAATPATITLTSASTSKAAPTVAGATGKPSTAVKDAIAKRVTSTNQHVAKAIGSASATVNQSVTKVGKHAKASTD